MSETKWYKDRFFHVLEMLASRNLAVFDDHALDNLGTLVKMVSRRSSEETELEPESELPPSSDEKISSCLLCHRLPGCNSFVSTRFASQEEMEYHMRAKYDPLFTMLLSLRR